MKDTQVLVIGLDDDNTNAYESEKHFVILADAFTKSLEVLTRCDHACIIDIPDYASITDHSYTALAPYSINISVGDKVK